MAKITTTKTTEMMTSKNIGRLALEAMLIEVSATPKPGLVDRNNSGAHKDMNFFTFMKSAASLHSYFEDFAKAGFSGACEKILPEKIFPVIRKTGIEAEKDMLNATNGINTHKGEIFSLGLLSASAGYIAGMNEAVTSEKVLQLSADMCRGICEHDFSRAKMKSPDMLTKGEAIYLEHGISGIRGEAEKGYPVVKNYALPALKKYLDENFNMNDSLVFTLINIMAVNDDTNIIARHGVNTCEEVKRISRGMLLDSLSIDEICRLDAEFIRRGISPSGSADLLAVTYFLYMLEK